MRENAVERLFSLFTSPDRAEAIAGDLAEEREQRGWIWFWLHAARITFALWRSQTTDAPMRVLGLTLTGCALLIVPAFAGAAAVGLFPQLMGSPVSWIVLSFFWWGGALWAGNALVSVAPRRGMAVCATVAFAGEALLILFGVTASRADLRSSAFLLFYTTGLAAAVPLLVGGAVARRRLIACGTPLPERHQ